MGPPEACSGAEGSLRSASGPRPEPAWFPTQVEPRDRLGSDWVCRAMLAAADQAGFACVEERKRRLDGVCRPDWEVDVYAFALRRG